MTLLMLLTNDFWIINYLLIQHDQVEKITLETMV